MQSDNDTPKPAGPDHPAEPTFSAAPASSADPAFSARSAYPDHSAQAESLAPQSAARKITWAIAALTVVVIIAAALWAVSSWQTSRTIANVESSLAGRPQPGGQARLTPNATALQPEAALENTAQQTLETPTAPPVADRLPPLVLPGLLPEQSPGQQVPAAVLRDLPDWVVAEVTPVQASGTSGDESAAGAEQAVAPPAAAPRRQRTEATPRADRYGAVFARCPGPGQSGAVECRRAVCDGAARKAAACAPYLK